jgi:hydroxypyruvate reductase
MHPRAACAGRPNAEDGPFVSEEGRAVALAVWEAALDAAAVAPLVRRALVVEGSVLQAGSLRLDLSEVRRVLVLGAGKASAAIAQEVEAILGGKITGGLVVVKDGYGRPTKRIRVVEASHPVPDERGQRAAAELLELARGAGPGDLVVVLISGGASALLPAPAPPITLDEKRRVTSLLLGAGATIGELNAVRKHLSLLKGGQLARAAAPATVLTLVLSDVIGNPIDVIGSGPTAPDTSMFGDALGILDRFGLRGRVPPSVLERLGAGASGAIAETPKPGDRAFDRVSHVIVGDNTAVIDAAAAKARGLGYAPVVTSCAFAGEAREAARDFVACRAFVGVRGCVIAGGETTVKVRGAGRGGRCQEFALSAALELERVPNATVLAAGTDGTDGPTDAAGAIADGDTVRRALALGLDPGQALEANNAYAFFDALGDLIVTGPTGTNLLDVYLLVVE